MQYGLYEKQERFFSSIPFLLFDKEIILYPRKNSFKALNLNIEQKHSSHDVVFIVEEMKKDSFLLNGVEIKNLQQHVLWTEKEELHLQSRLFPEFITPVSFDIEGPTNLISGNEISLDKNSGIVNVMFICKSTLDYLQNPIFRVRRKGENSVTNESLGAGNGTDLEFEFNLANKNITPGSLKITFTASSGLITGKIVDEGRGYLASIPQEVLLAGEHKNSVDYQKGKINLSFREDYVPQGAAILVDYEYSSVIIRSEHLFHWFI